MALRSWGTASAAPRWLTLWTASPRQPRHVARQGLVHPRDLEAEDITTGETIACRNLSATFEASLRDAVRRRKAAVWLEEKRAVIQSSNDRVKQHGLPLEQYRKF